MTRQSKPKVIQQLALSLEKRASEWLDDPTARFELVAYEATKGETGYTKYSAPEGGFDDTVVARCLSTEAKRMRPLATLTTHQLAEIEMPLAWRSAHIATLTPEAAQMTLHAREEEYEEARQRVQNKRRPKLEHSDEDMFSGNIADIY